MATSHSVDATLDRELDEFMTETGNSPSPPREDQAVEADEAPNKKRKNVQDNSVRTALKE